MCCSYDFTAERFGELNRHVTESAGRASYQELVVRCEPQALEQRTSSCKVGFGNRSHFRPSKVALDRKNVMNRQQSVFGVTAVE